MAATGTLSLGLDGMSALLEQVDAPRRSRRHARSDSPPRSPPGAPPGAPAGARPGARQRARAAPDESATGLD